MIYVILLFLFLMVIPLGVSFYMYIRDRKYQQSTHPNEHKPMREIPSYELSSWIDDEVAKNKLYRKPDMSALELAAELGISERRLKRTVNNAYNKTVAEYLDDRRVQAACRLLRDRQEMPLETICIEAGFASLKTFQAIFQYTMGQTPEQYRNMTSKQN